MEDPPSPVSHVQWPATLRKESWAPLKEELLWINVLWEICCVVCWPRTSGSQHIILPRKFPKELGKSTCHTGSNPKINQVKASLNNVSICNFNPLKADGCQRLKHSQEFSLQLPHSARWKNSNSSPPHSTVEKWRLTPELILWPPHVCWGARVPTLIHINVCPCAHIHKDKAPSPAATNVPCLCSFLLCIVIFLLSLASLC